MHLIGVNLVENEWDSAGKDMRDWDCNNERSRDWGAVEQIIGEEEQNWESEVGANIKLGLRELNVENEDWHGFDLRLESLEEVHLL